MSGFFIGIDVGGTNLKAGLTDETGRLLAAARRPLDFRGAETFAADLADLAAEVLSTAGAVPGDAEGVGIGLIGVAAPSCVTIWFPERKRGLALGIWATWVPVGSVVAFNTAPAIAGAFGYQAVFFAIAAVCAVAFVLFALWGTTRGRTSIRVNRVEICSDRHFSASAIPFAIPQLDNGSPEYVRHPGDLVPDGRTHVNIESVQSGLGCVNSWGRLPRPEYLLPYGDYSFNFLLRPVAGGR